MSNFKAKKSNSKSTKSTQQNSKHEKDSKTNNWLIPGVLSNSRSYSYQYVVQRRIQLYDGSELNPNLMAHIKGLNPQTGAASKHSPSYIALPNGKKLRVFSRTNLEKITLVESNNTKITPLIKAIYLDDVNNPYRIGPNGEKIDLKSMSREEHLRRPMVKEMTKHFEPSLRELTEEVEVKSLLLGLSGQTENHPLFVGFSAPKSDFSGLLFFPSSQKIDYGYNSPDESEENKKLMREDILSPECPSSVAIIGKTDIDTLDMEYLLSNLTP